MTEGEWITRKKKAIKSVPNQYNYFPETNRNQINEKNYCYNNEPRINNTNSYNNKNNCNGGNTNTTGYNNNTNNNKNNTSNIGNNNTSNVDINGYNNNKGNPHPRENGANIGFPNNLSGVPKRTTSTSQPSSPSPSRLTNQTNKNMIRTQSDPNISSSNFNSKGNFYKQRNKQENNKRNFNSQKPYSIKNSPKTNRYNSEPIPDFDSDNEKEKFTSLREKIPHLIMPGEIRRTQRQIRIDGLADKLLSDEWIEVQRDGWKFSRVVKPNENVEEQLLELDDMTTQLLDLENEWGDCVLFVKV